ncbi:MAG: PVC-type heme-binding CxxCH protein [Rubripirellula sp.]
MRIAAQTLLTALVASLLCTPARSQDDFSSELPRIPATDAKNTLGAFSVAAGFEIQLVAAEPLISSPVAIEWDAAGGLYVCEMRGYSEDRELGISRITRLTDTDGDGEYDDSTVFADSLLWPTALFPFDGGLFVGDAPNLYYFKDTNGDGKADLKKTVLTGFGTSNVQGLFNSFRWGLDSRIHVACSSVGGKVRRSDEPESAAVNVRGRDIAFDPRTFEFELTSGAAQHGMCFDDWGRKFVSSNSNHIQQVMYEDRYIGRNPLLSPPSSRLMIAADGPQAEVFRTSPVEPWRIVRTRLRVSGKVSGPVEGGGRAAGYFTGATGITIYRGDAWPQQWSGTAIIGDVGSNLIHRKRLTKRGVDFIANRIDPRSEFVTSSDIWFRPAQFANAPDGSLHVIDVCREVIEHPKSLPPEIKQHLDLTAGRDRGRIYRIVPDGFKNRSTPDMTAMSTGELVQMLEHANAWHRETAARLLFTRQDRKAVPLLRRMAAQSDSPLGRLHAIYSLSGLSELNQATVLACLAHSHPQVRRHAVRLSETLPRSETLAKAVSALASDDSLDVRYQLAFTIGSLQAAGRLQVLGELIRQDVDQVWMQAAVQSSLANGAGPLFVDLVSDPSFRSSQAAAFLKKLASQIGQQNDAVEVVTAVEALPKLPVSDSAFALPIVGELLKYRRRSGSEMAKLAKSGALKSADAAVDKLTRATIVAASADALALAQRVAAVKSLAFASWEQAHSTLEDLIDNRQPHQVQTSAIATLGKFSSPTVAKPLLESWKGLSPGLRQAACEVLFARDDRVVALLDAVDAGKVSAGDLPRPRLLVASKSKNKLIRARASILLEAAGSAKREEVVVAYRESLRLAGDLERGRGLFKKHCSVCHKVEGVGHEIGPNLATIKTRGAETILVNVLDPNREVNPQFLNYVLLTEDGRTMTGMISAESASSITLRRAESATDTVLRVEIDQLQSTGLSIMPEGMEETIDKQAMADIIRYLMSVK